NTSMTATQKEHYIKMLKTGLSPKEIKTDPAVITDLWRRIHLPDGDPEKITDPAVIESRFGNGLTIENVNALRAEMQGKGTAEGRIEADLKKAVWQTAKSAITGTDPLLGLRDPKGEELLSGWLSGFLVEWEAK